MTSQAIYNRFLGLYLEQSGRYFGSTAGSTGVIWAVEGINDGVDELRSELIAIDPAMLGLSTITVQYQVGVQEYALPLTFQEAALVQVTDLTASVPFPRLDPLDFEDIAAGVLQGPAGSWYAAGTQGEPAYFYIRMAQQAAGGGAPIPYIGFIPIPARTAASANVKIWEDAAANDITAIDSTTANTPDLPADWHPLLAYWLCIIASRIDAPALTPAFEAVYNARLIRRLGQVFTNRTEEREQIAIDFG